jgi:hypothetical protein
MAELEGYHEEWVPESENWRLATSEEMATRKCRRLFGPHRPGCGKPPVAALLRGRVWWLYCDEHLYGRRIEDGRVMHRRLVEDRA